MGIHRACQPELVLAAEKISAGESGGFGGNGNIRVRAYCAFGAVPYAGEKPEACLFTIAETEDVLRAGIPALWHHKATRNTALESKADARLERRRDKDRAAQDKMLARQGGYIWYAILAWHHNESPPS